MLIANTIGLEEHHVRLQLPLSFFDEYMRRERLSHYSLFHITKITNICTKNGVFFKVEHEQLHRVTAHEE